MQDDAVEALLDTFWRVQPAADSVQQRLSLPKTAQNNTIQHGTSTFPGPEVQGACRAASFYPLIQAMRRFRIGH
eukprot:15458033-Alexandrium_andersonii.AAC.1